MLNVQIAKHSLTLCWQRLVETCFTFNANSNFVASKFLFPSCFLVGYGFGVSNSRSARTVDADASYVGQ